jgi:hypothetical protein
MGFCSDEEVLQLGRSTELGLFREKFTLCRDERISFMTQLFKDGSAL